MFNRETNKSRGFGFVIFHSELSVDAVCEVMEHRIDDKVVRVLYIVNKNSFIAVAELINACLCDYPCVG